MNWIKTNIKWVSTTVVTVLALAAFLGDLIPMPAKAADLDQLADIVQQTNDTVVQMQKTQKDMDSAHRIKHLQDQVANIRLQFISLGKKLSPEAIFYITEKETEIENIRKGEE